jgi:ankyrin repeat protein
VVETELLEEALAEAGDWLQGEFWDRVGAENENPPHPISESTHRHIFHELAQYMNRDPDLQLYRLFLQDNAEIANLEDSDGATPLHYASLTDNFAIFKELLSDGANINARTRTGKTVLHFRCCRFCITSTRFLLDLRVIIPHDIAQKHFKQVINSYMEAGFFSLRGGPFGKRRHILTRMHAPL